MTWRCLLPRTSPVIYQLVGKGRLPSGTAKNFGMHLAYAQPGIHDGGPKPSLGCHGGCQHHLTAGTDAGHNSGDLMHARHQHPRPGCNVSASCGQYPAVVNGSTCAQVCAQADPAGNPAKHPAEHRTNTPEPPKPPHIDQRGTKVTTKARIGLAWCFWESRFFKSQWASTSSARCLFIVRRVGAMVWREGRLRLLVDLGQRLPTLCRFRLPGPAGSAPRWLLLCCCRPFGVRGSRYPCPGALARERVSHVRER